MLMKFGWGEDPTPDEMPYRVESYTITAATEGGTHLLGNIEPLQLEMKISIAPENAGKGVRMWEHGRTQHGTTRDEGHGKIAVYRGEGVGQSVLEIRFTGTWIAQLDQSCSASDDRTVLDIVLAVTQLHLTAGDDGSDLIITNEHRYSQVNQ
jgi:hypothetical protein